MKKQKMRFISAVLAACMMTSVLPVNALALGGGTPENGATAQEDTAVETIPFEGTTITKGGNYEIPEGKYAGNITVNLTDTSEPVNIAIKGDITYNGTQQVMFINVKNADEVTITNDGHEVNCKPSDAHFLDVYSGNVTVNGGTYVTATRNVVMAYAGTTTLNDMTTETSGYAVTSSGSAKVVVNRGTHTHSNTNQDRANFWIFNDGHMTLNDVNAISEEAVILNSTGTVDVNGGDFKTTGTKSCFVNNSANLTINKGSTTDGTFVSEGASCIDNSWGQVRINGGSFTTDAGIAVENRGGLRLNGGTVEAPNGIAIDISGESGDVQLNGGTIRNSVTGVRVADAGDSEIDLKAVTFENNTDDISLGNDQQINIKKSFVGTAKIRVDDPARGRQITTDNEDLSYQNKLKLFSMNSGYIIGYKRDANGVEYRYLADANGNIVNAGAIKERLQSYGCDFAATNDTEVISPRWMEEMVMYAQQDRVGCVGAKLLYPDNTIQHAGIGFGFLTLAAHMHKNFPVGHPGYMGRLVYAQDVYAVTAACLMVRRSVYEQVNGLDESFAVAFNDVDFCVRVREAGYTNVFTPFAQLYHYESKSRGLDENPVKRKRFISEVERFQKRWAKQLAAGDPCMNPNFDLMKEDFSFDIKPLE